MKSGSPVTAGSSPTAAGQGRRPRGGRRTEPEGFAWSRWLGEPKSAVLVALIGALAIGGGRKLLLGWRARKAVNRLDAPDVTAEEIEATAKHGRAGLIDLFRILGTAEAPALRDAAGRALAVLWARDDLIVEEEKGLVRRGYVVSWRARRRYPRALRGAIPISVAYGVPFLSDEGNGVGPSQLEWSHRILGARRAGLESFSPWVGGPGRAEFQLIPGDFETNGPHKLVLETRVRTAGLTDAWELDLPHMPFQFDFDPLLLPEALYTLADDARARAMAQAVRLAPGESDESRAAAHLDLNADLALREPPTIAVTTPLPCDLAHSVAVEFEGIPGRFAAGGIVVSGQATGRDEPASTRQLPLGPIAPLPPEWIDRPGNHRLRAILTADPDRGWADPDVRSIWPETIETEWVDVRVVRR